MKPEKTEKPKNRSAALAVFKKILLGTGVIVVIGLCAYLFLFTLINLI